MQIGMMTPWNANSGPSISAELVGREWVKAGHKLTVFSHDGSAVSDGVIIQDDEPFVKRCFGVSYWGHRDWLDTNTILQTRFETFLVQHISIMPMRKLLKIFHKIREKSNTVLVVHESSLPTDQLFYRFLWNALVCFDERYKSFLIKAFPPSKIHVIPFPYHPLMLGDKRSSRLELGLPLGKKIVLFFGYSIWRNMPIIPALTDINKKYPLLILALSTDDPSLRQIETVKKSLDLGVEIRREAPSFSRLYKYLHASDVLVKHVDNENREKNAVLLSSTIHMCLGSGCPIVVSDAKIFETYDRQVLKYHASDLDEFKERIIDVFEEREALREVFRAAKECVEKNSAQKIAEKYIRLFRSL